MIRTVLAEHEAWSTGAAAVRAGLVSSLLSDAVSVDVDEASQILGYNLRRTHEAVVVSSPSPAPPWRHCGPTLFHYPDAESSLVEVTRRLHVSGATVTYRAFGVVRDDRGSDPAASALAVRSHRERVLQRRIAGTQKAPSAK